MPFLGQHLSLLRTRQTAASGQVFRRAGRGMLTGGKGKLVVISWPAGGSCPFPAASTGRLPGGVGGPPGARPLLPRQPPFGRSLGCLLPPAPPPNLTSAAAAASSSQRALSILTHRGFGPTRPAARRTLTTPRPAKDAPFCTRFAHSTTLYLSFLSFCSPIRRFRHSSGPRSLSSSARGPEPSCLSRH